MAKGDYVKVTSEIAGTLKTDDVTAGSGGSVEATFSKDRLVVKQLGRTGKTQRQFTYLLDAVRSVEEKHADE